MRCRTKADTRHTIGDEDRGLMPLFASDLFAAGDKIEQDTVAERRDLDGIEVSER